MQISTVLVREFQILSRRASGYWLRVIFIGLIFLAWVLPFIFLPNNGSTILLTVTIISIIIFGISAGVTVSDSISSERREDTLGLLILTPLSPFSILMGKLTTGVLQYLLSLFAVTPFLALPILSGGVTWGDILRCCLSIWTITFLGLSIGLFWTVLCRHFRNSSTACIITALGIHIIPIFILLILISIPYRIGDSLLIFVPLVNLIGKSVGTMYNSSWYFWSAGSLWGIALLFLFAAYIAFRIVWHLETNPNTPATHKPKAVINYESSAINDRILRPLRIDDRENPYKKLIAAFYNKQLSFKIITYLTFILIVFSAILPFFKNVY